LKIPIIFVKRGERDMGFFQDISPIFKKRELAFLERRHEFGDVYTFIFEMGNDLNWKAGQHGVFTINHKKIKKPTRPFSVASASSEKKVKISMRIGDNPSEFKQAMLDLKQGMTISMRGPVGPMYIDNQSPALLIAGGIGITPFRAILKHIQLNRKDFAEQIHLLYIDSQESFLYKDELDGISNDVSIGISYHTSRDALYREVDKFISQHNNDGYYYVAGAKNMVDSISTYLKSNRILKRQIKKDAFMGYK
jgi:predicted ferric reductase